MWRDELLDFLGEMDHPAWGRSHSRRVLESSLQLAQAEKLFVDEDVLFAAAFLHDVGAIDPYRREGVDHAERSAGVAPVVLEQVDFDPERLAMVVDVIRGHMYYAEPEHTAEARVFHDADSLDYMGAIGVARILAATGAEDWPEDLAGSIDSIRSMRRDVPAGLVTESARSIAEERRVVMEDFLQLVSRETDGLRLL
jgi:uncharacterized protein